MGISGSLGSNTFDILICLGLPWFIKAAFLPQFANVHEVHINSDGLEYTIVSLLVICILFYFVFAINKFKLDKKVRKIITANFVMFQLYKTILQDHYFNWCRRINFLCMYTKIELNLRNRQRGRKREKRIEEDGEFTIFFLKITDNLDSLIT